MLYSSPSSSSSLRPSVFVSTRFCLNKKEHYSVFLDLARDVSPVAAHDTTETTAAGAGYPDESVDIGENVEGADNGSDIEDVEVKLLGSS